METRKYLRLVFILTCFQIYFIEGRLSEKRRDKSDRRYHNNQAKDNICEVPNRDAKVHCYCENTDAYQATRVDCWVFNGGIDEADPIWTTFNAQPHIERLAFNVRSDGALSFVPLNVIHKLKRLKKLQLNYATLNRIEKRTFTNMSSVREITLKNNQITELDFSAFASLPSLVNLTIKGNKMTELQRDVFVDLPSLRYLDLSFSTINLVHDGCFEHLNVLNDLVLEANLISVLTKDTFRGLSNLTRLDLRSNKLSMIGDLTFIELWNLNELLLDNNNLKYLSERAFDGLALLQKLTMTGNKLQTINEVLLEGVRGLELLDLRNNEIELFSYETVKPILENLKMQTSVLYLSGNKLRCDCRLTWIQVLRNESKSEPLRQALDEVTCIPNTSESIDTALSPDNKQKLDSFEVESASDTPQRNDKDEAMTTNKYGPDKLLLNQVVLVDMPPETLPCPSQLGQNGEDSLMLSSKDENYWQPNCSIKILTNYLILALVLVII
ncbi:unnamed protein product [Leptosia nina]|uniref:Connectin n=1 Tax=Leptosia nina TaxID=320188 RepID=A0AAV1J1F0_9NEOP